MIRLMTVAISGLAIVAVIVFAVADRSDEPVASDAAPEAAEPTGSALDDSSAMTPPPAGVEASDTPAAEVAETTTGEPATEEPEADDVTGDAAGSAIVAGPDRVCELWDERMAAFEELESLHTPPVPAYVEGLNRINGVFFESATVEVDVSHRADFAAMAQYVEEERAVLEPFGWDTTSPEFYQAIAVEGSIMLPDIDRLVDARWRQEMTTRCDVDFMREE